jgi:mRNA interferase MazF
LAFARGQWRPAGKHNARLAYSRGVTSHFRQPPSAPTFARRGFCLPGDGHHGLSFGVATARALKEKAQSRLGGKVTVVSHPVPGTIVRVDLSDGFRPPEMTKRRPAIILSPEIPGRPLMCTIVPLSTTPPKTVLAHHIEIGFNPPLPEPYNSPTAWLKGDIVLTVAFHRLRLLFDRWNGGQRVYDV